MYWIVIATLLLLWVVGMTVGYTLDGVIHLLPLMAIIVALIRMVGETKPVEQRGGTGL